MKLFKYFLMTLLLFAASSPVFAQTVLDTNASGRAGALVPCVTRQGTSTLCVVEGTVAVDPVTGNPTSLGTSSSAVKSFRQTCTTSAVQLPSNTLANGIVIKALSTNAGTVYIGPAGVTTATGYPLAAGEAISYGVANTNQLYLICSDAVSVIAATGN